MRTISNYRSLLDEIIENSEIELYLVQKIIIEFEKKGLNGLKVANLFNSDEGSVTAENIEGVELAGIFTELYKLTNGEERYNPCDIPARARENYEKGIVKIKNNIKIFEIEDMMKTSENSYLGFWKMDDIYKARKKGQIRYNLETQREASYRQLGNGKSRREATINMKSVKAIGDAIYNNTYGIPDMLTLNIPVYEGKDPNFKFEDGKITIKLDEDFDSETFTMIDNIDGEHRQLGVMRAAMKAEKEGRILQGGFPVTITVQTIQEAKNYVARLQKANLMSATYVKAIESNDYTTLVDEVNNASGLLQGKINITWDEMKRLGGYTHTTVIADTLKKVKFNVASISKRVAFKKAFAKIMNLLEENLKDSEYKKFENKYLACNMFAAYTVIADYMIENKCDDEWLIDCFVAMNLLFENDDDGKLKLEYKSITHIQLIIDSFKEVCEKVV